MGTKIITDVAHLIIAQVLFFLALSIRVLTFLYFPVPVVTSLLKHSQSLTHWMLNLRDALKASEAPSATNEMTLVARTTPSKLDLIDDILTVISFNTLFCKVP